MLVLTRRLNESITLGDDIVLTVIEVRGDQVRLGINAPRDMTVHRMEVWLQVQDEKRAALRSENLLTASVASKSAD